MDKLLFGTMKRAYILACSKAFDWCSSDVEDNFIRKVQNEIFLKPYNTNCIYETDCFINLQSLMPV